MTRVLDVYLHEEKAGQLEQDESGILRFAYDSNYLSSDSNPAISVAMPLREELFTDRIARAYFSGLLPDERARRRLASALGVSEGNVFGLLEVIGGECAGALSLMPQGTSLPDPESNPLEPLKEAKLVEILELLRSKPLLAGESGVRLSLAGAQDKLAVCLLDGQIALPGAGQPTTHILKPFIEGLEGTVENEVFCMRLAEKVGLTAPKVSKGTAGKIDYFLIERYDRVLDRKGVIKRLHQEDFCQALSVPPELKYEEEGGPGIAASQDLIARYAQRPAADRLAFMRMVIFHYLVGNADAHAKNYALLYRDQAPDLAPLYDVVCTAAYPNLAKQLAMKIGGRAIADTILWPHWASLVPQTKLAQRQLKKDLQELSEKVKVQSEELLRELDEEGMSHPVLKKVHGIIGKRVRHVQTVIESASN